MTSRGVKRASALVTQSAVATVGRARKGLGTTTGKRQKTSTSTRRKRMSKHSSSPQKAKAEAKPKGRVLSTAEDRKSGERKFFLIKSEPESRFENGVDMKFSIDDLAKCKNQTEHWDGVRNYAARNIMRDEMKLNDQAFFYHSNCKQPGIVGIVDVVRESYADFTAFDPKDPHYDARSTPQKPLWFMVDVKLREKFPRIVTLEELKKHKSRLADMDLFKTSRLSVQRVPKHCFEFICDLARQS